MDLEAEMLSGSRFLNGRGEHIGFAADFVKIMDLFATIILMSSALPPTPCMYACMHVCMYACMHGCMDAWMHGCMDAWMHVCMDACKHVCM